MFASQESEPIKSQSGSPRVTLIQERWRQGTPGVSCLNTLPKSVNSGFKGERLKRD